MKSKKLKALSLTLVAALTVSLASGSITTTMADEAAAVSENSGIQITDSEMVGLLAGDENSSVTVRSRQSVHDPSIVVDGDNYYVYGSHMAAAKTTDLENWTALYSETTDSTLFANAEGKTVSYNEAFTDNAYKGKVKVKQSNGTTVELDFGSYNINDWIADNTVQGNMWAPDVIYNTTMEKWCMYLSLNGANWNSSIILLTSDSVEGPYVYQGPVVFSGFSTADSTKSFHDTDLELVLGDLNELPAKYDQIADATKNGSWGDWWPHAIDPCVFYDDDGNLWMSYGSWSGGIFMLQLDESTGLRDYTVTYESNSDSLGKNYTSDAYFGTKIAGGYYVSGEGSYIQKIGKYYYLFLSYGGLTSTGGYEMRVFRSETPDGPYVDSNGTSAIYSKYVHNYNGTGDNRGERLMASYKWDTMSVGETAQGHNSAFVDKDGKAYVVYHTRFTDGTEGHELRVHQLFVNADGWLVAAPYEYDGETLSTTGYTTAQVAGEYDTILHSYKQSYGDRECATPLSVSLNADGTISGTYTGTWTVDSDNPYITLNMDGHIYKGVLIEQKVDNENYSTLCFTAVNEEGLCIWGSMAPDAKNIIALNVKNYDFGVPASTYTDLTLPTEGNSKAVITWTSSNPEVLSADGKIASERTEDVTVTLTARISYGGYYYDLPFEVVVKAGDGTFTEKTLIASYFENDPQDLSTKMDGSLSVANPFYGGTSKGIDISGGVDIAFDVESTGDVHALGTILSFMGSGRLYFTPGSYLGYNATGGYFDANVKSYALVKDYIGDSAHVEIKFQKDGFAVYVNGELAYDQSITSTENGAGTVTDYTKVLSWLNQSADTLYFGYGSWWAGAGYDEANCKISNVKCYVEATGEKEDVYSPNSSVWYEKDSLTLESNDAITYEDNPFYGVNTNCLYMAYTINFADDAAKNGWDGVFSFYNSTTKGRISVQTNPYVCFNDESGNWVDLNNPNNSASGGTNWAATAETGKDYRVEIYITKKGITTTIDGEEIPCSYAASGTSVTYETLLDYVSGCDKITWGVGKGVSSYWWTEMCTLSDIVIAGSSDLVKLTEDDIVISSNDYCDVRENPFQGKDIMELDIDYTINFSKDAAKNGWDGIFSFYNSTNGGRASMQTNPYLCYNSGSGDWLDLNNPNNSADGGTNWAATAETGKDYQVSVKITEDAVSISIDGKEVALSKAASSSGVTAADILSFISECDQFTFGVGQGKTSYWYTELSEIKNFTAKAVCRPVEEKGDDKEDVDPVDPIEQINDNSWKINASDAILYLDNPVAGQDLTKLEISYDVEFASNAAKNGWDGLFSFYDPDTTARVSVQSAPYLCYNEMGGDENDWADINNPSLDGATDWAASASKGVTYHVGITVTADEVIMTVDGETIATAQSTSAYFKSCQDILDQISACKNLTIGVGSAVASFWDTELCTLSNLEIVGTEKKQESSKKEDKKEETEETETVNRDTTTDASAVRVTGSTTVKVKTISNQFAVSKKISLKDSVSFAADQKVIWTTSNKKYATVSSDGVVTTKKAGIGKTVTVTAKAVDGSGKRVVFKIEIMSGSVQKLSAKASSSSVKAGSSVTIKTTVKATKGANKKLTYTSSNKKYATVTSKGVVKTKKAGKGKTVKITVAATDGSGKKTTVKIKIK
jgi:arabinan endo-1,5-alpha-L-arabinosidase